jgi:phosphate-selective porin OprO and OprP
MNFCKMQQRVGAMLFAGLLSATLSSVQAADKALLDVLMENGIISQEQYDGLMKKETLAVEDIFSAPQVTETKTEEYIDTAVADAVTAKIEEEFPVKASHGSSGFRFETADGNFQTNLQWRAQVRATSPYRSDPRSLINFAGEGQSNFEARRLRMKIGGHGFQPWLKYYFEVDLQPSRDPDSSSSSSSARVIDYRIDVAKWDWGGFRVGQWKIDHNRERVDSSGRQQFVERSIVNRTFTIDRQVGVQVRGRAFDGTRADLRYYAGVFNGEGRSVNNADKNLMYTGRLQWNFMGRDLAWRQTDVNFTEKPTGSLAFAGMSTEGPCTLWSSSGCGNLDGYTSPAAAEDDQFKVEQWVQEFAFKYRGFSVQQEYHRKNVVDRVQGTDNDLSGLYVQSGYFFHNLIESFPAPLELAARYAYVEEPNRVDRSVNNERKEYTLGLNWFFSGHNNKVTLDYSHLTLDDGLLGVSDSDNRVRLQWDVSF